MLKSHLNSLSDARRYQLERTFGLMDYSYTPPPTGADHDQEPPLPSDRSTTSCNDTPTTSTTNTALTLHTQATLHVDSPWISCESLSRVAVFSFWASAIYCSGQLQHRKLHRALLESSSIAARLELLLRALQSRLANASGSSFASLTDSSSSLRMSMTSSTEFASISAPNTLTHSLRQACCEAICHRIIELTTNASSNLDDATAAASRQQLLDAFTTTCSIEIVQQIVDHFLHRLRPLTREHFEALCALNPSRTYRLNLTKARIDASWASLFAHFHRLVRLPPATCSCCRCLCLNYDWHLSPSRNQSISPTASSSLLQRYRPSCNPVASTISRTSISVYARGTRICACACLTRCTASRSSAVCRVQ